MCLTMFQTWKYQKNYSNRQTFEFKLSKLLTLYSMGNGEGLGIKLKLSRNWNYLVSIVYIRCEFPNFVD